ncbi:hypothetical protein KBC79_03970 [Candidatus Woesebacteria bacterium]|nr:hypothetical protein [Candidatus Woesebacteria bacterium]
MTIAFEKGDVIKFKSWQKLQRLGKGAVPVSETTWLYVACVADGESGA